MTVGENLEDMLESLMFDGDDVMDGAASASAHSHSLSMSSHWRAGHQAVDSPPPPPPLAPVETKRPPK
eukprot:14271516-Alexandrium_andersonii.AAC.1